MVGVGVVPLAACLQLPSTHHPPTLDLEVQQQQQQVQAVAAVAHGPQHD